ncbi:MAG: hypothetical protein J0L82_07505 [Deltaproteobacteria bacterium]|jgi:hypothetical protein|nr:hypothetical protein [Deltaproteobacteria bacterium]
MTRLAEVLLFLVITSTSLNSHAEVYPATDAGRLERAKDECHYLLGRGPGSAFDSDEPGATPAPRPTPLPDVHLVRYGKVMVFNQDRSVTVIREDGSTTVGDSNKCEKSEMTLGKYTANRFVELAKYVKAQFQMPKDVQVKMNKWLIRYFDNCSKVYPDVEALRPMLADIQSAANKGEKNGPAPRTGR